MHFSRPILHTTTFQLFKLFTCIVITSQIFVCFFQHHHNSHETRHKKYFPAFHFHIFPHVLACVRHKTHSALLVYWLWWLNCRFVSCCVSRSRNFYVNIATVSIVKAKNIYTSHHHTCLVSVQCGIYKKCTDFMFGAVMSHNNNMRMCNLFFMSLIIFQKYNMFDLL